MGKYYRNGRLWSAETFDFSGTRTLAAATESDLWSGTAATRPQPGGIQLRVVSTSAQDDSVKTQKDTITFAGTMDPITTDVWKSQIGGSVDTGDILRLTLDGVNFDQVVEVGATKATLAAAIGALPGTGTKDYRKFSLGGTIQAGDKLKTTIAGVDYEVTSVAGTAAEVAGLAVAAVNAGAGDPYYTATQVPPGGGGFKLVAKAFGVPPVVACVWSVDGDTGNTVTETHYVTGVAASANWNGSDDGVDRVIVTHKTAGATAHTVASSVASDAGGATTFVATHFTTGAAADVLAISDGTTTFSHTVTTAVLADEVAALAALINASPLYVASSALGVITVDAATPGVGFTLANASTDNQNADMTVTIAHVVANGAGTGVQSLRIDYLDGSGVPQFEIVTMDGLTQALTVATGVGAILGISATAVGTNGSAVGTISVTNIGNTATYGTVAIGSVQDTAADFTVRSGREGWVTCVDASAGAVATTVKLCSDTNPATGAIVPGAKFVWASALFGTNPEDIEPEVPFGPFPAGCRIWLTGTSAGGTACVGTIHGYLTQN